MHRMLAVLLSSGLALAPFAASQAQNPQTAPPGDAHPPLASPSAPTLPPEQVAPGPTVPGGRHTLSERLAQQNGTLQPPEIGDRAAVIRPQQGVANMPVIRPPGNRRGKRGVGPK